MEELYTLDFQHLDSNMFGVIRKSIFCRFQSRRDGIFVEKHSSIYSSPVGAASILTLKTVLVSDAIVFRRVPVKPNASEYWCDGVLGFTWVLMSISVLEIQKILGECVIFHLRSTQPMY